MGGVMKAAGVGAGVEVESGIGTGEERLGQGGLRAGNFVPVMNGWHNRGRG